LVDVCLGLSAEQLQTTVPGIRGPILETLRHIVAGDAEELFFLTGDSSFDVPESGLSLPDARLLMERNGSAWAEFLSRSPDPDAVVREVDSSDGFERSAPIGFRLAGALDHGTDHRSQICTVLTTIGVQPPPLGVMTFGVETGRVVEVMPKG
jgi:uncharacterized damage-inducible protein DinB